MKRTLKILAATLILAGFFVSCLPPGALTEDDALRAVPAPIQVTVTTNKPSYYPGEVVTMILTAKNVTQTTQKLTFTSTQRFDFAVSYQGKELWRWSNGKVFLAVMGSLTLPPGGSVTYRAAEYKAQPPYTVTGPMAFRLDLTGTLTSVPPYSGKTQFQVGGW